MGILSLVAVALAVISFAAGNIGQGICMIVVAVMCCNVARSILPEDIEIL